VLRLLFTLGPGKSRMFDDPAGRGFYIVKVDKIVPGNSLAQPGLITQMQTELRDSLSQDYADEFLQAVRAETSVKRNDEAIRAMKARMASGS
jgi:peptidyl-prolyl cis-trans isomerase D